MATVGSRPQPLGLCSYGRWLPLDPVPSPSASPSSSEKKYTVGALAIEFKEVIRIDIERIELKLVCEEFIHRDPTNLNHRRPSSQRELLSMEVVDRRRQ